MKVLVIGSSGFVGSNLKLSLPDVQIYGLDTANLEDSLESNYFHFVKMNFVTNDAIKYIERLDPEHIVLLAGVQFTSPIQRRRNREKAFSENVVIARQAAKLLKAIPTVKKLVYVSTDMVYGIQSDSLVDEECEPKPIGEYGKSKLKAEEILSEFGARIVIFRPRLIIGPGRAGTIKLVSRFISAKLPIPLIGQGANRYQMISVFDLWNAIEKCFVDEISGVFNLGSNNPPTLNELFPKVLTNLGRSNRIIRLPRKFTEVFLYMADFFNLSPLAP